MSPSASNEAQSDPSHSTEGSPENLSRSVRAGIAAFFGASADKPADPAKSRADYGRLIADLEQRIVDSLRESDQPPPTLGAFTLEERIGRGGFAVVYRATHKRTGARAAVKVVPSHDIESRRRVASEVDSLARLRHPNIVRVIDTGEESNFAWIATEYIAGMTLADAIREMKTPPESFQIADELAERRSRPERAPRAEPDAVRRTIGWFRDLAYALDALHTTGLVHRDVKPANIMLDRDRRPVLIDFGLSSSAETTVSGILAGTVPYMSPEQTLGGYVALTPRSDVYSLAATMHEVLTGERITRGVRREAILHQIAFVAVVPPSTVSRSLPSSLDPIFARALAKDSNARYATAKDLAEDLDRWLSNRALLHVRESARAKVTRAVRRHPVGSLLASAAAIALIGWAAFGMVTRERNYRSVMAAVRASLDGGDGKTALKALAANVGTFGTRKEFRDHYREAAVAGGPSLVHEILSTQAFAAAGISDEPRHVDLARQAAVHLEHSGLQEPNLLLVVGLSKWLGNHPAEARAFLDGAPLAVQRSRPLMELSAIVAIAERDLPAFHAAVASLEREAPPEVSYAEICLRAWRLLFCRRTEGIPSPSTAEMQQLEADVARILKNRSDHGLARALLGLLKLDRKDYRGARVEFDDLVKTHGGSGDRAGSLVMYAVSSMMTAGDVEGPAEEETFASASRYAKDAITNDPGLHDRFLHEILGASAIARARWILDALTGDWNRRPTFGARFLTFSAMTAGDLTSKRGSGLIERLSLAIDDEYGARLSAEMKRDYMAIRAFELKALRDRAEDAVDKRADEAARLLTAARACVATTRARTGEVPYVMLAGESLVAAFQAELHKENAGRAAARTEAITLLRNVTSPVLLATFLKNAQSPEASDQIHHLSQQCATRLEMMESED